MGVAVLLGSELACAVASPHRAVNLVSLADGDGPHVSWALG